MAELNRADTRLRAAYDAAADVGVPSSILAEYQGEWGDLKAREGSEPLAVTEIYRVMARELDEYAGHTSGPE